MSKPIPASVEENRNKLRSEGQARKDARAVAHQELLANRRAEGVANREARAKAHEDRNAATKEAAAAAKADAVELAEAA